MNLGTLFLVTTPIGNLEDITLRAIEVLKNAEYIACEDTRRTGNLLKSLQIEKKAMLISYYEGKEQERIPNILNILKNGEDVALVSDSGTPLISDPGYPLVRACLKDKIKVVSVPGAVALITALTASGQPPDKFTFLGFLPKKQGNRLKILNEIKKANEKLETTIILYEAPHRIVRTMLDIRSVFGEINLTLARELTKIYEEIEQDYISNFLLKYEKNNPKGEFVILLNPKTF